MLGLADLEQRKEQLIDAFVYRKAIDQETYQQQLDKLNQDLFMAKTEARDAELEGYDIEAVLNFAEYVLMNVARLWTEFNTDQKQRLQKVLFPEGVTFTDGIFRTNATSLIFSMLQPESGEKSRMATPTGFEPVPTPYKGNCVDNQ